MDRPANILFVKSRLLRAWGLKTNPSFPAVPSNDVRELIQVFVNREAEMQRAILTLDDGENILVRGMIGIGKTAFIMATLYEMERQGKELDQSILPIHIRQFAGGTRDDFYRVILYALAKKLGPSNKRAREIVYALTGEEITKGRALGFTGGIEVQIPQLVSIKGEGEVKGDKSKVLRIEHPEHFVDELLDLARKKYDRVLIAVDDLDRSGNPGNIKQLLESCLDLIRDRRCSFVLTGRTLTILEDIYSAGLGIFNETIALRPLSPGELYLIAARTLNRVRVRPDEGSVFPFDDDVIATIASLSSGIPRRFVLMCGKILKIAIENNIEVLTSDAFRASFERLQDEIADRDVPPEIRRVLFLGLQQGGFAVSKDANLDEVFDILGITTLGQFIEFAETLVQQDLLDRLPDNRGEILYRLAPGVEKLAEQGDPNKHIEP